MENINKYIGIVHTFNGDTLEGADCIGLCRMFYKDHGWSQDFTDGHEVTEDWQKKDRTRLLRYLQQNFTETKEVFDLQMGDIVLMNISGDFHLGIYLEYGKLLAMQCPVVKGVTTSTVYHRAKWMPYFKRGFRRE